MSFLKNKINITSTSFLIPNSEAWKDLNKFGKLKFSEYGNYQDVFLNCNTEEDLVFIIFFQDIIKNLQNDNDIKKIIKPILDLILNRCRNSNNPIVICSSSWTSTNIVKVISSDELFYQAEKIFENEMIKLKKLNKNLYYFKLDNIFYDNGIKKSFDSRNWYLIHCRLSYDGLNTLSSCLSKIFERIKYPPSKVLILDCDNTLWGGVIGEDGLKNIKLGQDGVGMAYLDFQKKIKKINDEGTLLAIVSKNNLDDVLDVFENHQMMILRKDDITAFKVNWKEKFSNIKEISQELGLSLDSFVFWDDSPIERDKIIRLLPDVKTINLKDDVTQWPNLIDSLDCFSKFTISLEDKKKKIQYKIRSKFISDKKQTKDISKYLMSINLKPKILTVNESNISRTIQLLKKTNQFNLTTRRHEEKNIYAMLKKKENVMFLVSLSDNYGDHGIVGLVIAKIINNKIALIDTFLMSCRVIGRYLESWMLNSLINKLRQKKIKYLIAEYIPTKKNFIVKNFLSDQGLKKINEKKTLIPKDINVLDAGIDNYFICETEKIIIKNLEVFKNVKK